MDICSSLDSIGGRVVCLIDQKFFDFLDKFLTTQSDSFVSFGNLIAIGFTFFAIACFVVYAFKLPMAMSKLYEALIVVLICGLTINATFIFGFLNFFDGIALALSKTFFSIANPDIEVNYYWDLYAGIDDLARNVWSLTKITWDYSVAWIGDLEFFDVALAIILSILVGVLYLTFTGFLLIAIAGKYIFACLFPFVALASILPISRYIFAPYIKQLLSFIFMVAMLSLMMGITTATFSSINDNSSVKLLGESSLFDKYNNLKIKVAESGGRNFTCENRGVNCENNAENKQARAELEVIEAQLKPALAQLFNSSLYWSILLLLWIAIFYHLKSSDWISLIIGSQAVQGMGAFITATAGAAGGAMAAGRMAQSPLNSGFQASHASKHDFAQQSVSSMAVRSVRSILGKS